MEFSQNGKRDMDKNISESTEDSCMCDSNEAKASSDVVTSVKTANSASQDDCKGLALPNNLWYKKKKKKKVREREK